MRNNFDYNKRRQLVNKIAHILFAGASFVSILVLLILLSDLVLRGTKYINLEFFTNFPSRFASKSGILPAMVGSLWLVVLTAAISIPVSVAAAVYLEEYAMDNRFTRFIKINISNLAGVPSIVYGILGLSFFVRTLGLGRSILSGALTMSLLIMPIMIVASQEAIRMIPNSLREGSYALGASKWKTVKGIVVPGALPGIMTGIILAISRALGESAPLLLVGAFSFVSTLPKSPMDSFIVMPIQIYSWMSKPSADFKDVTAAAILVLMVLLLTLNMTAIVIRNKFHQTYE